MAKKIRTRIELNKTNKQLCGKLDILCDEYRSLDNKIKILTNEFEIIKENIKSELSQDADYYTTQYKLVVSIQPEKTEFKYDMKKILEVYPEIKENKMFGDFKTKAEIKSLKSVEGI